jgi:hypothetical protein
MLSQVSRRRTRAKISDRIAAADAASLTVKTPL